MLEAGMTGSDTEEYVFFNGKRVARRDVSGNAVHYYFADHLGSADVVSSAAGVIQDESDYYPYGGEIVITNSDPNNYKFSGKERDSESGLDMFGARYYGSSLGRFMTPDWAAAPTAVPYAHFGNPQSLNLYGYVQNNPTTLGDPDGHVDPVTGIDIAAEIASYIATHPEEVQAVEAEVAAGAGAARWGLLAGPALYFSAMLHPATVGQSDADEEAEKTKLQQEKEQNEEKQSEPEPKTDAGGAKKKDGGQKPVDPNAGKKADDLISGSGKKSKSYHSELGGLTKQQILERAAKGDRKAQQMKKLIEQKDRLQEKVKNKKKQ